jgi:type VI secretion system secreted protein VgrG
MPVLELSFASGETSLSVRRFSVHEAASSLFTASIWARSPNDNLDLGSLVGRAAGLRVASGYAGAHNGGARLWTGICSQAEQIQAEHGGLSSYSLRIVPTLWLLSQRRNYRIFQHLSIPDIADELLAEWTIEPTWRIERADYPKLAYRVQYGESDYAFLSRLLEEAGIAFTFPEDAEGSKLTLADKLHTSAPREAPPIHYAHNPNEASGNEYVSRVRPSHQVRPGAHTIRDVDLRRPSFALFGEAPRAPAPEDRYEQYHYQPGAFLIETDAGGDTPVADDKGAARHDDDAGTDRAERALSGKRSDKREVSFETNAVDLAPGVVFSIGNHPHAEITDSTKLLVTELSIEGSINAEWRALGRAVFADVPYRPRLRTAKPRIVGVQSATVVGPAGEEIHTDEFGRVRVQFPWDREGESNDGSSCWIRVSQGWGGAGFGVMMIPRIGQEVLVAFLHGDPDQPVIVGRMFNATSPVPYRLPDNKTISAWKSDSSLGSGGFNEIKFEDRKDDELFYVQAEKNLRKLVKNNETITVSHDREKHVSANETDTTGANRTEVTGADRKDTTTKNHTTLIGADRKKLVKKDESERTDGDHRLLVKKDQDIVVKGKKTEQVVEDEHIHVKGDRNQKIDGKQSLIVVKDVHEEVGDNHALEAGKTIHLHSGEVFVAEAAQDMTIKGPGGFIRIDAAGVTISGTLVKINAGGSAGQGRGASPDEPEFPQ